MRSLAAVVVVITLAASARAHFVFVYVEGAEAKLVFGHRAEPDPKTPATRCEKTALTARDAAGKETKLAAAEKGDGNYYRAKLPAEKPVIVYGTTEAGVTQFGDNPPLLSWYYPKVIVGDPFAKGTEVSGAALDIVPVRDGGKVRLKVLAAGKPAEGVEVTVALPGKGEDKDEVVKTDRDGLTTSFADAGRYCAAARKAENTPGEAGGKKYTAVRHTTTIVFDFAGAK